MKLGDLLRYINFDEKIEICTQELETNFCEVKHKGQWKREDVPEKWLDYDLVGIFPLVIDHSLGLRVLVEVEVGYEHAEFKIGDKVVSDIFGEGIVDNFKVVPFKSINPISSHIAIEVIFDNGEVHYFSLIGEYLDFSGVESDCSEKNVRHIDDKESVECDAVNPSHYNVKGVQQPIDVMRKLFTEEQLEGFLWGNIIKYAHRYGRKSSKKDTAGKIEQYAKWLKELEKENEVHN